MLELLLFCSIKHTYENSLCYIMVLSNRNFLDFGVFILWKEITVEDWAHFTDLIDSFNNNDWIFRGQSNTQWSLVSSLHRECKSVDLKIHNENCIQIEGKTIREFKSSYKLYSNQQIKEVKNYFVEELLEEKLSILSIMQHYGAPTRLLDWTYSPYIAGFFALDGARDNFCIYALNLKCINSHNMNTLNNNASPQNAIFYVGDEPVEYFLYPYDPIEKNQRLRIQQGLFLVPSLVNVTFDEILEKYGIENGKLDGEVVAAKLIFEKKNLEYWWAKLIQMNITHETIYPGLEGFCKSLKLNIFK